MGLKPWASASSLAVNSCAEPDLRLEVRALYWARVTSESLRPSVLCSCVLVSPSAPNRSCVNTEWIENGENTKFVELDSSKEERINHGSRNIISTVSPRSLRNDVVNCLMALLTSKVLANGL